jgi:hypothetical protein
LWEGRRETWKQTSTQRTSADPLRRTDEPYSVLFRVEEGLYPLAAMPEGLSATGGPALHPVPPGRLDGGRSPRRNLVQDIDTLRNPIGENEIPGPDLR